MASRFARHKKVEGKKAETLSTIPKQCLRFKILKLSINVELFQFKHFLPLLLNTSFRMSSRRSESLEGYYSSKVRRLDCWVLHYFYGRRRTLIAKLRKWATILFRSATLRKSQTWEQNLNALPIVNQKCFVIIRKIYMKTNIFFYSFIFGHL